MARQTRHTHTHTHTQIHTIVPSENLLSIVNNTQINREGFILVVTYVLYIHIFVLQIHIIVDTRFCFLKSKPQNK